MTHYLKEIKASVIHKMMSPNHVPVDQLIRKTDTSGMTLYS